MNDRETTLSQLKEAVLEMCVKKGWGDGGVQNVQQVAMAMTVEMSEVLEHFQWMSPEDVRSLMAGENPLEAQEIAEEFADVMMYGLQLARTLNIDISAQVERKIGIVMRRPPKDGERPR